MFDPTVFENMKVVLEGAVYDLDLAGDISVTNRSDLVDLATMSRQYNIQFEMKSAKSAAVVIELKSDIASFHSEKVEGSDGSGCDLFIIFLTKLKDEKRCVVIEKELMKIWKGRPTIKQHLTFTYDRMEPEPIYINRAVLSFDRKITEDQMEDITVLMTYILESIEKLNYTVT